MAFTYTRTVEPTTGATRVTERQTSEYVETGQNLAIDVTGSTYTELGTSEITFVIDEFRNTLATQFLTYREIYAAIGGDAEPFDISYAFAGYTTTSWNGQIITNSGLTASDNQGGSGTITTSSRVSIFTTSKAVAGHTTETTTTTARTGTLVSTTTENPTQTTYIATTTTGGFQETTSVRAITQSVTQWSSTTAPETYTKHDQAPVLRWLEAETIVLPDNDEIVRVVYSRPAFTDRLDNVANSFANAVTVRKSFNTQQGIVIPADEAEQLSSIISEEINTTVNTFTTTTTSNVTKTVAVFGSNPPQTQTTLAKSLSTITTALPKTLAYNYIGAGDRTRQINIFTTDAYIADVAGVQWHQTYQKTTTRATFDGALFNRTFFATGEGPGEVGSGYFTAAAGGTTNYEWTHTIAIGAKTAVFSNPQSQSGQEAFANFVTPNDTTARKSIVQADGLTAQFMPGVLAGRTIHAPYPLASWSRSNSLSESITWSIGLDGLYETRQTNSATEAATSSGAWQGQGEGQTTFFVSSNLNVGGKPALGNSIKRTRLDGVYATTNQDGGVGTLARGAVLVDDVATGASRTAEWRMTIAESAESRYFVSKRNPTAYIQETAQPASVVF